MARHERIKMADVLTIREALKELPEKPEFEDVTKRQAIKMLSREIGDLQSRGYKLEQIGQVLEKNGMKITKMVLKGYLTAAKSRGARKSPKGTLRHGETGKPEEPIAMEGAAQAPTEGETRPEAAGEKRPIPNAAGTPTRGATSRKPSNRLAGKREETTREKVQKAAPAIAEASMPVIEEAAGTGGGEASSGDVRDGATAGPNVVEGNRAGSNTRETEDHSWIKADSEVL